MFKTQVEPQAAWKIVVDLFFTIIFFFSEKPKTKQPALRDMLCHFRGLYSHRP